jgi:putative lipoic acid-binding regulatory protein
MKDQTQIEAGSHFSKTWTFRNDGQTAWPMGTKLVQSCGDDLKADVISVLEEVQPNSEIDFTVQFTAPSSEGKYTSFFRLQIGNIKFGQKVWCDVMVVKPKPAEPAKPQNV